MADFIETLQEQDYDAVYISRDPDTNAILANGSFTAYSKSTRTCVQYKSCSSCDCASYALKSFSGGTAGAGFGATAGVSTAGLAFTTLVELAFFDASTGPSATGAILTPAIGAKVFCVSVLVVLLVVTPLFILITYLTIINSNIFLIFFQYKRINNLIFIRVYNYHLNIIYEKISIKNKHNKETETLLITILLDFLINFINLGII